ncbi:unnamed protein product [Lactuca saligna]|uniref:Uncharacterized protein n=1 Tax=Lactuca saligna TaxID=75948 RepID=A0AA36DWA9_LACSI|nr:unnamed protein product [Lactuca saligna]
MQQYPSSIKPSTGTENCDLEKERFVSRRRNFPATRRRNHPNQMDAKEVADYRWTNERHLHFLNSVEASFVQTMLGNNDQFRRMDRCLPDDYESTLDSKASSTKRRRRRHSTSDILDSRLRSGPRITRLQIHPESRDDQVVPQIENTKNKQDEGEGQKFVMTTSASSM